MSTLIRRPRHPSPAPGTTPNGGGALVAGGRRLADRGLVTGSVGNLSVRDGERVLVTPTRVPYEAMTEDDLVTVALDGRRLAGRHAPSRELALHLAIYRARPDARAVVHAHGPHAVAWSFLGVPLAPPIEEAEYYGIGTVRVSDHAPAGSVELGGAAVAALQDSAAVLLARHGAVTVACDLDRALVVADVVEHHAQVACLLRAMGAGSS
jgi:L-fuculose-phosphate aldolase